LTLQLQSDGYLVIIQPKKVEVAEIQESLLSKDEYKQFRALSKAIASSNAANQSTASSEPPASATSPTVKAEAPTSEAVPMEE
jgi:hypothetical protein